MELPLKCPWVLNPGQCESFANRQANTYGVYSRISFYRGWLDTKMTSATFCPSGPNADTETSTQPNVATSTSTFSGMVSS